MRYSLFTIIPLNLAIVFHSSFIKYQMRKLFKFTLFVFILLILAIVVFYFWASSSHHSENEYHQLIENNYSDSNDTDSVYTIITYNLGYLSGMTNNLPVPKSKTLFDENLKRVYNEFEKINADIICFQEIDYYSKRSFFVNQQKELQILGYNYIFQAVNWDINYLPFPYFPPSAHHGRIYSGQSIFSKYPLKEPERIVLEQVANSPFYRDAFYIDRLAQVSKTTIGGKTVVLINVHLEAYDKVTRINQTRFIAKLFNEYKNTFPVLLAGDFNSDIDDDNAAINIIMDIPGIRSASHNEDKTYPSNQPNKRIDYIFYNELFLELKEAEILTSFGQSSDHLPLMMKFKLK